MLAAAARTEREMLGLRGDGVVSFRAAVASAGHVRVAVVSVRSSFCVLRCLGMRDFGLVSVVHRRFIAKHLNKHLNLDFLVASRKRSVLIASIRVCRSISNRLAVRGQLLACNKHTNPSSHNAVKRKSEPGSASAL